MNGVATIGRNTNMVKPAPRLHGRPWLTRLRGAAGVCLLTLAAALGLGMPADAGSLPAPVEDALKAAGIAPEGVAIVVQELGARRPRIQFNSDVSMNPASVMKLVTVYAALELLGPAYTWRTEVLSDAELTDGVLKGDLIVRGSGDPKLTFENFWLLLRQLKARGIREIRGDLVLDRGAFADAEHDPGSFDQEPLRPYNVGPDALLLNFKSVRLQFVPDAARRTVAVVAEPHPAQMEILNLLKLTQGPCRDWRAGLRVDQFTTGNGFRLVLNGTYPESCGERRRHFGVLPHPQYVLGVFRQLWRELGGKLQGGLREGSTPEGARLLAVADSPPLAEIVRDINKFSNNVMARQILLTLGAEQLGKRPARSADGALVIYGWLVSKDLRFPELVIDNGSGLSRRERISADSLARLLIDAYASAVMPEFTSSLPLVAVDGTMKKRLVGAPVAGYAHVKTGTLEGVRSLAGYVLDKRGRRHAVVFLVNGPNAARAQSAQDRLLECIHERTC